MIGTISGRNPFHGMEHPIGVLAPHQRLEQARAMRFDLGGHRNAIGRPTLINIPELAALGARRHHVLGDGSCWARATWQCVFSQILDNEEQFNAFVAKILNPPNVNGHEFPLQPDTIQYANETIHILYQLKNMTPDQRIAYLNHENVDTSLVMFMRHICAGYVQTRWPNHATANFNAIRNNFNHYCGSLEIDAFLRYFQLEKHAIDNAFDNDRNAGQWKYFWFRKHDQYTQDIPVSQLAGRDFDAGKYFIFGVNNIHYEFITFDPPQGHAQIGQDLERGFQTLSQLIEADFVFARMLQHEFDAEVADRAFAEKLQQQFGTENLWQPAPARANPIVRVQNIKQGSQANASGSAPVEKVRQAIGILNYRRPRGVKFNLNNLTGNLQGGACSAMAVAFLKQFIARQAQNPAGAQDIIKSIPNKLTGASSENMRVIQAAYNQIERDPENVADDFERAKIDALLGYRNLDTSFRGEPIVMTQGQAKEQFIQQIAAMADGAFMLRLNLPSNNVKGEECGHSMVLIKEGNRLFFYDPNTGVDLLEGDDGSYLFDKLTAIKNIWGLSVLNIYGVKQKSVEDSTSVPEPAQLPREPAPANKPPSVPKVKTKSKGFFGKFKGIFISIGQAISSFFKWLFRIKQ